MFATVVNAKRPPAECSTWPSDSSISFPFTSFAFAGSGLSGLLSRGENRSIERFLLAQEISREEEEEEEERDSLCLYAGLFGAAENKMNVGIACERTRLVWMEGIFV